MEAIGYRNLKDTINSCSGCDKMKQLWTVGIRERLLTHVQCKLNRKSIALFVLR